jgi:hypothetical protein
MTTLPPKADDEGSFNKPPTVEVTDYRHKIGHKPTFRVVFYSIASSQGVKVQCRNGAWLAQDEQRPKVAVERSALRAGGRERVWLTESAEPGQRRLALLE